MEEAEARERALESSPSLHLHLYFQLLMKNNSPDQYGSIGWASSLKSKGRWFDSRTVLGLRVQSLVGARSRGN